MNAKEQGYDDYWHYNTPRQPTNPEYMDGWQDGLAAEIEDIEASERLERGDYDDDDYDGDI